MKDCIQDLFLFLWQKRAAINETPSVEHYLMKALRRRLERALTRNMAMATGHSTLEFMDLEPAPDQHIILQEQSAELEQTIKKSIAALSKRQQEIIYLRFYLNADAAQIADIMQLNRQSVYNLLHEAINHLRHITEQYFKPTIGLPSILLLIACSL